MTESDVYVGNDSYRFAVRDEKTNDRMIETPDTNKHGDIQLTPLCSRGEIHMTKGILEMSIIICSLREIDRSM